MHGRYTSGIAGGSHSFELIAALRHEGLAFETRIEEHKKSQTEKYT